MVSVIGFILSFFQRHRLIQVRRTPVSKPLRVHLLGLTLAFLLSGVNLIFALPSSSPQAVAALLLWLALTTYFSGLLFLTTLVAFLLLKVLAPAAGSLAHFIMNYSHWYLLGYAAGAGFAILYNDLVFLFLQFFEKGKLRIAFVYNPREKINFIKSPLPEEEDAFETMAAHEPDLRERRLYQYRVATPPAQPYTVAFVANPKIRKVPESEGAEPQYEVDPIILDLDLFLSAVDRALISFESDAVLGRPEIWSRVRLVTIFNSELISKSGELFGLVEEEPFERRDQEGRPIKNNVITPRRDFKQSFTNIVEASRQAGDTLFDASTFDVAKIDVIFALTASPTHDRSSASYSDWRQVPDTEVLVNAHPRTGTPFTFNENPDNNKNRDRDGNLTTPPNYVFPTLQDASEVDDAKEEFNFRRVHDFFATEPGCVALNVVSARLRTYIHEFAHAMSSFFHGTIGDEYVDCFLIDDEEKCTQEPPHFFVNRIDRLAAKMHSATPVQVPKLFAEYNHTRYHSDLDHPSAEEGWTGYFPERFAHRITCMMDRDTGGRSHFDELLSAFIYDRLVAKMMRPAFPPPAPPAAIARAAKRKLKARRKRRVRVT